MTQHEEHKPLVTGRSVMPIADFCHHTALEPGDVEPWMRSGELDGLFDEDDRPCYLFSDPLPSVEHLRALGLGVSGSYRPDELSSDADDEEDPDEPDEAGPTWTMSWPEPGDQTPSPSPDRSASAQPPVGPQRTAGQRAVPGLVHQP